MAQRIKTTLLDDLEKRRSREVEADETLEFSLEGKRYSIDLTAANAIKFRARFDLYVQAASRLPVNGAKPSRTVAKRQASATVRTWARQKGYPVSERGRIPEDIVREYEAAH